MVEFVFEACVDSLYSALQAEKGGAGRLELCSGLSQGGITPSYGVIKAVVDQVRIPLHVLVRPRSGDFCYSETEIKVICEDIEMAGRLGVQGIAFGALTTNGDVDMNLMQTVTRLCRSYGLSLTFHRAFDATRDPEKSLQDLLELSIPRLLTSGQSETVTKGLPVLQMLMQNSMQRISIMPGGGITEKNAADIVRTLGVYELHGSARSAVDFGHCFVNSNVRQAMIGNEEVSLATDCNKVRAIVDACRSVLNHSLN